MNDGDTPFQAAEARHSSNEDDGGDDEDEVEDKGAGEEDCSEVATAETEEEATIGCNISPAGEEVTHAARIAEEGAAASSMVRDSGCLGSSNSNIKKLATTNPMKMHFLPPSARNRGVDEKYNNNSISNTSDTLSTNPSSDNKSMSETPPEGDPKNTTPPANFHLVSPQQNPFPSFLSSSMAAPTAEEESKEEITLLAPTTGRHGKGDNIEGQQPGAFAAGPTSGGEALRRNQPAPLTIGTTTEPISTPQYSPIAVANPVSNENLPVAHAYSNAASNNKNRRLIAGMFIGLGLLAIILAVVLSVVLTGQNQNDAEDGTTNNNSLSATPIPSRQKHNDADDGTTNNNSFSTTQIPSREEHVQDLLRDFTLKSIATDPLSPQAKAYTFVMSDPWLGNYSDWRIQQRFALATLYYATGGEDSWLLKTNWLSHDVHECLWYSQSNFGLGDFYVTDNRTDMFYEPDFPNPCEEEDPSNIMSQGVFKNLWLWGNLLKGPLPPELFLLTGLKSVSLDSRDLSGTISTLIGELQSMKHVSITGTELSGSLPSEIGLLKKMRSLSLIANQLTGSLPLELGQLMDLSSLMFDSNVSIHSGVQLVGCFAFPSHMPIEFYIQHSHRAWIDDQVIKVVPR